MGCPRDGSVPPEQVPVQKRQRKRRTHLLGWSGPTYDGIPPENISIKNVKGQVTEAPRNLAVEVLSVERARRRQSDSVRPCEPRPQPRGDWGWGVVSPGVSVLRGESRPLPLGQGEAHSVSSWGQSGKHFSKIKAAVDGGEQGQTVSPFWGTQRATQPQPPGWHPCPGISAHGS